MSALHKAFEAAFVTAFVATFRAAHYAAYRPTFNAANRPDRFSLRESQVGNLLANPRYSLAVHLQIQQGGHLGSHPVNLRKTRVVNRPSNQPGSPPGSH